jgi:hypothetical protein
MNITQAKICAQPIVGKQLKEFKSIFNSNLSPSQKEYLRAVSLKGMIWDQQSIIYIKFTQRVPIKLKLTREEDYAKPIIKDGYLIGFAGPEGDIDPKTNEPKIYKKPYRTSEGYIIDKNDKPIVFDPLEQICYNLIRPSQLSNNRVKFDKDIKDCIKMIVKQRLEPFINLTFKFIEDNDTKTDSTIRIGFDTNAGSYSELGNQSINIPKNTNTMNLGWFDVATVLHEFGHMLGLDHEHQGPSGGIFKNNLIWNKDALYKWGEETQDWTKEDVDIQIINRSKISQINDLSVFKNGVTDITLLQYDPDSIMLYFYEGYLTYDPISYNRRPRILKPGPGTTQNCRLSVKDVKYLNALYPGPRKDGSQTLTADQFIRNNPHLFKKPIIFPSQKSLNNIDSNFDCEENKSNCDSCNFKNNNTIMPYFIGAGVSLIVFLIVLLIILKVKKIM